jgi:predicted membrane-bound spermidine synthase
MRIPLPSRIELISFATGFGLLTFELVAARILAPVIGNSTYVWTGVIGTIIAALSLGFWVGGKLADKRQQVTDIVWLLCLTSLFVMITVFWHKSFLADVAQMDVDVRLQAVIAAMFLFAPTSFFIGTTSPYLAKLQVSSLKVTGQRIASLDAMNALGGIVGTFVTGFVLFGYIGSRQTLILVALLLLGISWLISPSYRWIQRALLTIITLGFALIPAIPTNRVEIDTASAHYEIVDFMYNNQLVRGLATGPSGIQSAVSLTGSKDPVFWYTREIARVTLEKKPMSILILGGGTFTLPRYLADKLPLSEIDVVEIDPGLEEIAKHYFNYESSPQVELIFSDARSYVNKTDKHYDTIIVDVYGDASIPFSFITKEYGKALAKLTKPKGIVLVNIIGGLRGPCRNVYDSVNAAYMQDFRFGSYSINPESGAHRTNIIALYSNESKRYGLSPNVSHIQAYDDNYSPSERLYFNCLSVR